MCTFVYVMQILLLK